MHWLKKWYEGEKVFYKNEPGSPVVFFGWDEHRHWTARIAHVLVDFYLREWKWIYGALFTLAGLFLAYQRLG
jgi:hypothetical protein